MKNGLIVLMWAATLAVAGIIGWRATGSGTDASPLPPEAVTSIPTAAATSTTPRIRDGRGPAVEPTPYVAGPIQPIPEHIPLDLDKVRLGDKLFHDARLSSDGTVSCATCHRLEDAGVDRRPVSIGVGGALGDMNAPTVLNCGFNFTQFWDGRARTLEDQVDGPIHNPKEMNSSWADVIAELSRDAVIVAAFRDVYGDLPDEQSVKDAIVTFERSLYTPNARFDLWLKGDHDALTADEVKGYEVFLDIGCVTCHQGVNIGGNMFQVFGKINDYFGDRGIKSASDRGRYNVTGRDEDMHKFKVPTLRNVAHTAPYLHDGSVESLHEVVRTMAWYELGAELADTDVDLIVGFLKTLSAEVASSQR